MQLYRIQRNVSGFGHREDPSDFSFAGTLADAQEAAKAYPKTTWAYVYVDLFEIPVDKAGMLALLNSKPVGQCIRCYELSDRGALRETEVDPTAKVRLEPAGP